MKCVKGLGFLWVAVLAAFFALSACDDSSSASSDETGVSSSSVESPDSSVTLSGASAESNGSSDETKDKSSSSDTKSSSSTKETKVSSDSKSSSSVKSGDSSSSNKDKSSSSVSLSSSEKQSSSSSEKQSSSSSVLPKSSSSVFEVDSSRLCTPGYDYCYRPLGADSLQAGAYKKFKDTRNGREYFYLTINGKDTSGKKASVTVFAENLNIGEMVDGSENQSDNDKIERYCYNNDTTNCVEYGGLYQWAEMMNLPFECNSKSCADSIKPNHQGICPKDWRLMTYNDFYIVVHADGNDAGVKGVRSMGFGGLNYTGYSLIGAGMRLYDDGVSSFIDINEAAYWFFPTEKENKTTWAGVAFTIKSIQNFDNGYGPKIDGYPVRCVKID
ncbi:MAG: FISUMP domain-containing protein [Fibrobacter sp.]|nr:FISUMP domain-containing protein [Fibrobacter sp.]